MNYGVPRKHWSFPDRRVVDAVVAQFLSHDRVVLLTENTRNDQEGLWRILHNELKPALELCGNGRLGFWLAAKRGASSFESYCAAIREALKIEGVRPGFVASKLPVSGLTRL